MSEAMSEHEKYQAARTHVAALKGFYVHALVFGIVMCGLAVADFAGGGDWWVHWPLLGWGTGVLVHAYLVFSSRSRAISRWEHRKIRETMAKM